jgi:hypothetical protein
MQTLSPHAFSLAIPVWRLDVSCVVQDRRDERIAELEAALADRDTQLAVKDERIAELERLLTVLGERLEQLSRKLGQSSRS